jgi:hypothetical protein
VKGGSQARFHLFIPELSPSFDLKSVFFTFQVVMKSAKPGNYRHMEVS